MYIIIHKYQRWSDNGKTKQKYLKKICQRRNKQTNKTKHIKIRFVGQEDRKPFQFRSLSSDKSIKLIFTLHLVFRGKTGRFLVFFLNHLQYVNKGNHCTRLTPLTDPLGQQNALNETGWSSKDQK